MRRQRRMKTILGSAVLLLIFAGLTFAGLPEKDKVQGVQKVMTNDLYRPFLINNIFNYYGNNGDGSYNKFSSDNEGFEFPKGSGEHVIFEDGVVWGGFPTKGPVGTPTATPRSTPTVGGSVYRHGLQAGKILTYGTAATDPTADDASLPNYRVYRVRPDINPSTPFDDAMKAKIDNEELPYITRYESYTEQAIYNQYIQDWNQWPAADGAPFAYGSGRTSGAYDPTKDIPGVPGADQTLWYVANDLSASRTANLSGSPPIGLEMQKTIWGYKRTGALGYTIFASSLIINKSGAAVDSMFLVQWTDPDLGDAGDDFVGCDVPRNLGFVYNGRPVDAIYGTAVPAGGFVFFQGPIVPSTPTDSAVFRLHYRHGFKNLKMTTFVMFTQGVAALTDPTQGSGGDTQWYRLMNGLIAASGSPFINPKTNLATKFVLDGDPVAGTGWIDGPPFAPPADRRMCIVSGPFNMAAGDSQEVVVGNIAGLGSDRISSIAVLRWYTDLAQAAYNDLFNLPSPPASPNVQVAALDREVVLNWGDPASSQAIENGVSKGYAFEGYNVYQLPGPAFSNPVRIATYDIVDNITTIFDDVYDASSGYVLHKPVEYGGDFGISHVYDTKMDVINSRSLINATPYYFAVTAYSYNPSPTAKPVQLESAAQVITVTPQAPNPGTRYPTGFDSSITAQHTAGIATATADISVANPQKVTGDNYEVRVVVTDSVLSPSLGKNVANPRWQVYDVTKGVVASSAAVTVNNPDGTTLYNVVDGVNVGVVGSPFYVAGKELGSLTWTPSADFNFTGVNSTPYPGNGFINSALTPDKVASDVQIVFTGSKSTGQNAYDFVRQVGGGSAGSLYTGFFPQPFKVYDLNPDGTQKGQIDFAFMETLDFSSPSTYDSVWAPGPSTSNREYWFFIDEPYTATPKAKYTAGATLTSVLGQSACVWSGWYVLTNSKLPAYKAGDVWTIKTTKIVTTADKWAFSTAGKAPVTSTDLAKSDADKINVFPNPYLGFNAQEINKYNRFVTFTHLPPNATLRIFNLAGVLIRTLVKNDPTQFIQWDLNNERGFPASAGVYIAYIDMPNLGKTKVLKLAIIPEQQYIDRW